MLDRHAHEQLQCRQLLRLLLPRQLRQLYRWRLRHLNVRFRSISRSSGGGGRSTGASRAQSQWEREMERHVASSEKMRFTPWSWLYIQRQLRACEFIDLSLFIKAYQLQQHDYALSIQGAAAGLNFYVSPAKARPSETLSFQLLHSRCIYRFI